MTKRKPRLGKLLEISTAEAVRRHAVMDEAIRSFRGNLDELEGAVGMYMLGHRMGWKVLYIIHSKKTVRQYEAILGIDVRAEFEEEGPDVERSLGFLAVRAVSNFWKFVSGEVKIDLDRESRRSLE